MYSESTTTEPDTEPMSAHALLAHLRRQGFGVRLDVETIWVESGGRLSATDRARIQANRRGLLELLAREQGRFKPERQITFQRERRVG